jgi:hypothetical protein
MMPGKGTNIAKIESPALLGAGLSNRPVRRGCLTTDGGQVVKLLIAEIEDTNTRASKRFLGQRKAPLMAGLIRVEDPIG